MARGGSRREDRDDEEDDVRLDKWLWAARFFKTRALAHAAIEGGKVLVDGVRGKPSRTVQPGQTLRISSPRGNFTITVKGISLQRGPASVASTLYEETGESKHAREEFEALRRYSRSVAPDERPNTQDRRILRRIKEGE